MKYLNTNFLLRLPLFLSSLLIISLQISCGNDDTDPELDTATDEETVTENNEPQPEPEGLFADVLRLGALPNSMATVSSDTTGLRELDSRLARELFNGNLEDVRYTCSEFTIAANTVRNKLPLWGSAPTVVYAGSFVQGESLAQGSPEAIPAKRSGGTLVLGGVDQSVLATVDIPEFNNTQVGLGRTELLSQKSPVAAPFQVQITPIADAAHLAYEIGWAPTDFQAQFGNELSIEEGEGTATFLVSLQQNYYDLVFELPAGMEAYFDSVVKPSDLTLHVTEANPAAFVSKVEYGRQFFVLLQTTTFTNTARKTIAEAFGSFEGNTTGTLQTDLLNDLESLSIKVAIRSNNAQGPLEEVGEMAMGDLANHLSETAVMATAQPLSYEVRGISQPDHRAGYALSATYDQVLCNLEGALPPEGFRPLVDLFEDGVGAAFFFNRGHITVFNGAGTEYAWLNVSTGQISTTYGIKDPNGLLPVLYPDAVRAAFASSNGGTIRIFNENGGTTGIYVNTNTLSNNDPLAFPTEAPIRPFISSFSGELVTSEINPFWQTASAPGETAPFLESGIEAAVYKGRADQTDPTDDASYSNYNNFFAKGQANQWVERDVRVVNRSADYFWGPVNDLRDVDRNIFPFAEVGAACALELERGVYQQVYFNTEGTQFFIANTDEELVAGPYLLY